LEWPSGEWSLAVRIAEFNERLQLGEGEERERERKEAGDYEALAL